MMWFSLSLSTTNSEKPHSIVNSTAQRQARISTSSLLVTGQPLVDKEAIISPLSLRIIAPTHEAAWFVNIAVSKFSLKWEIGGEHQLVGPTIYEFMESWVLAL